MKRNSKIIILTVNSLLCVLVALLTYFCMGGWGTLIKVAFYALAGVGFVFGVVTFILKKDALFKSAFVLVACLTVVVGAISLISGVANLNDYPTDKQKIEAIADIIKSTGGWGIAVYFLIQVLQVVVLPLPAAVCYIPGIMIWEPWQATLIASAGVIVGSVISYFIGKVCGKPAVVWIAGRENTEKYSAYFRKRGKVLFVLMQILPFFPDDILCMVVGLTGMNFWFFLCTVVLIRPLIIATYCYLGSGTVIPFSGWGIPVWIAIFAVCIVLAVLSFKFQDRIEAWLVNKFTFGRKKKSDGTDAQTQAEPQSEETDGQTAKEEEGAEDCENAENPTRDDG